MNCDKCKITLASTHALKDGADDVISDTVNTIPKSCADCEFVKIESPHGCNYYYCLKLYQYVDNWKATSERDSYCLLKDVETEIT